MSGPAMTYRLVSQAVDEVIVDLGGNDLERVVYMIARAALLRLRETKGGEAAAQKAYSLADEMVTAK
jgi:hypothetical protein